MLDDVIDQLRAKLLAEEKVDVVVRVRPHAAKTQLKDMLEDGSIKLDVTAPAEDGKGNAAVVRLVAQLFEVPVANVSILSGKTARLKLVRVVR